MREIRKRFWLESLKGKYDLDYLGVDERVILKRTSEMRI
jgi:hypothetical protein